MIEILLFLCLSFFAADRVEADRLFDSGRWPDARAAYLELYENSEGAEERSRLEERIGETWLWEGNLWEAETWFSRSVESEDSALARLRRGQVFFYAGQRSAADPSAPGAEVLSLMNDAVGQITRSLEMKPASAEALLFLGLCERYRRNPDAEEEAYRRALEIEPGRPDVSLQLAWLLDAGGELTEARRVLSLVDTGLRSCDLWLFAGALAAKAGDREEEVAAALGAIKSDPERNEGYLALWNATGYQKRFDEFETAMRDVLEASPDLNLARFYLGFCYRCALRPADAIEIYRQAVERDPADTRSRLEIAETLRNDLKDPVAARVAYVDLIRLDPENERAREVLASMGTTAAVEGDLDTAGDIFRELKKADPSQWVHALNLALVLKERGDAEGALRVYDEAEEAFPFEAQISNDRGLMLMGLGRREEALAAFATALERDAENLDALENLGAYSLLDGDAEKAIEYFRRACDLVRADGGDASKFRRYLDLAARLVE